MTIPVFTGGASDGIDDSIALNALIQQVYNNYGAGQIMLDNGPLGRIAIMNPILIMPGIQIVGPGIIFPGIGAMAGPYIKSLNSMPAMITSGNPAGVNTHSCGIRGVSFDARHRHGFTIPAIIDVSLLNSNVIGNQLYDGDVGIKCPLGGTGNPSWVHRINENNIQNMASIGIDDQGSDSEITGNYVAQCALFGIRSNGEGAMRICRNHIELCAQGMMIVSIRADRYLCVVVASNMFEQNGTGLYLQNADGSSKHLDMAISANQFVGNINQDIYVEANFINGTIDCANQFGSSNASTNISFGGGNAGWIIRQRPATFRVTNRPADLILAP